MTAARWLAEIDALAAEAFASGIRQDRMGTHWTKPGDRYFAALSPERVRTMVACCKLLQRWRDTYGGSTVGSGKKVDAALDAETDAALGAMK